MNLRMLFVLGLVALGPCLIAGCPDDTSDDDSADDQACEAPYTPFDAANYQNQFLRVGAYEQIVAIRKSEDFAASDFDTIEELYTTTASLQEKVQGREDDHSYATAVEIGAQLDVDITEAIAAGKAGDEIDVQGQIVDKTLQRFFFLSVYHEMMKSQDPDKTAADIDKGWDEAFGYFGTDNDGEEPTGIAKTLSKRDVEFGFALVAEVFNALLDGRCVAADADYVGVVDHIETADLAMLRGFALSVVHEMDEYDDDPLIKGWEALLYWNIISDYALTVDADLHAAVEAEFEKGVEAVDAPVLRQAVLDIFGFDL